MTPTTFIYGLRDPITGTIRYVGKANDPERRYRSHLRDLNYTHKVCWIKQLAKSGVKPFLVILEEVSSGEWQKAEQKWIKRLKSEGIKLVNSTDGGDGIVNLSEMSREKMRIARSKRVYSPEMRRRMSIAGKGRKHSPETLLKLSNSKKGNTIWKGKHHSPETRIKIGLAQKGKIVSPETIEKLRVSHLGQKSWTEGRCIPSDVREKISKSVKDYWVKRNALSLNK